MSLYIRGGSASGVVAAVAAGVILLLVVVLAAGPVVTADFWWHLEMGEVWVTQGLWPAADPMLFTAHSEAPVAHEWLFSVLTFAVDRVGGFLGVRIFHALAVAGLLVYVHAVFRREGAGAEPTFLAAVCFAALSADRLMQLRPDLVSIPATFGVYALLIAPRHAPSWARVAASVFLFLLWANLHSLFAIGLILLLAAQLGLGARAVLALRLPPGEQATLRAEDGRRAQRLAAAFGAGLLASLINPRGIAQLLTFHGSSTTTGIWSIQDEWSHFDPLDLGIWGSSPAGAVAALLLVALPVAALIGVARLWRRPSREALDAVDPVRFALGFAGLCALLISIRFLWMGGLALIAVLRLLAPLGGRPTRAASAALTVALAVALAVPIVRRLDTRFPSAKSYLETPYTVEGYHVAGVRFLRLARLEGNLFNPYTEGGFLGYWLTPRIRTFVDGRTEHYPAEVLEDYFDVRDLRQRADGRSPLDVLAARGVDLFFGVGLPLAGPIRPDYTTAHLERAPGWVQAFRAVDHAIYLRRNARNRNNLRRVAAYYASRGIPFDPAIGFDPIAAAAANPGWARTHQVVPIDWPQLEAASTGRDPESRLFALHQRALVLTLEGEYEAALRLGREALSLQPASPALRRLEAFALLRLGREGEALEVARALREAEPNDVRHVELEAACVRLRVRGPARPGVVERARILAQLPLLAGEELGRFLAGRYHPISLKRKKKSWLSAVWE